MIVVCSSCATRLQLDDSKVPNRAFTAKCPKCQSLISVSAGSAGEPDKGGAAPGSSENLKGRLPNPAPPFRTQQVSEPETPASPQPAVNGEVGDLGLLLAKLLQGNLPGKAPSQVVGRFDWERRKLLLCVATADQEKLANLLADKQYQVYVAADASQAVDRMREEHMDVVVLDADFDTAGQGVLFVTNEISNLRPAQRRRVILAKVASTFRAGDMHAAFVENVNLVVNSAELEQIPNLLERTIRDLNELYREFNAAMNVAEF